MTLAWIYLLIAGIFEIGWPIGFKLFGKYGHYGYLGLAIVSMAISGYFLYMAQQKIPIGTAYAVWTGIGAIGTFLIGIGFFGDPLSLARGFGVLLILSGVIVLKATDSYDPAAHKSHENPPAGNVSVP